MTDRSHGGNPRPAGEAVGVPTPRALAALDRALDEIRQVAEELRTAFAAERRAIARLDGPALERLAEHKRACTARLGELIGAAERDPGIRRLLAAVHAEAQANAVLAAVAAEAVRGALGQAPAAGYDRRARPTTSTAPIRLIATL